MLPQIVLLPTNRMDWLPKPEQAEIACALSVFGIATADLNPRCESELPISPMLLWNAGLPVAASDSSLIVVVNADQPAYRV